MSRQALGAVFTVACFVASAASAQVALGVGRVPGVTVHRPDPPKEASPARPDPPAHHHHHDAAPPAPGTDLFLAGPYTYAPYRPHDNRRYGRLGGYPGNAAYLPVAYPENRVETVVIREPIIVEVERPSRDATPARDASPAPPPVVIYAPAARPKTLYVIPRCYAGDRRPLPVDLPAGCDLALLRVIPASAS